MQADRVITIEYLEPSMARELLCKFPPPSAFDFDYSQSAIWSPLVPIGRSSISCNLIIKSRNLADSLEGTSQKKKTSKIQVKNKRIKTFGKKNHDPHSISTEVSAHKMGWSRMLKVASKSFKKHKDSSLTKFNFVDSS